ncbi:tyrosine-type recombinase/integrase [Planctomycetota bacterium]
MRDAIDTMADERERQLADPGLHKAPAKVLESLRNHWKGCTLFEGYPYVFVPPGRYDHIQKLRKEGKWSYTDSRLKVINNFKKQFDLILSRAHIKTGRFHDIRSTAITNWFREGLTKNDVMELAGHSKFETTQRYYLAYSDDLADQARQASEKTYGETLLRICCAPPAESKKERSRHA